MSEKEQKNKDFSQVYDIFDEDVTLISKSKVSSVKNNLVSPTKLIKRSMSFSRSRSREKYNENIKGIISKEILIDISKDKPIKRDHEKSKENLIKRSLEKPVEMFKERTRESPKEKFKEQPIERSQEKYIEQFRGSSRENSKERSKEKFKERPIERSQERYTEQFRESSKENSKERSRQSSKEKPKKWPKERSKERSQQISGKTYKDKEESMVVFRHKSKTRSREISQEQSRETSKEQYRERSKEKFRGQSKENSIERSKERSKQISKERSVERYKDRYRHRSREHSRSKSCERSRDKSTERCRERSKDREYHRDRHGNIPYWAYPNNRYYHNRYFGRRDRYYDRNMDYVKDRRSRSHERDIETHRELERVNEKGNNSESNVNKSLELGSKRLKDKNEKIDLNEWTEKPNSEKFTDRSFQNLREKMKMKEEEQTKNEEQKRQWAVVSDVSKHMEDELSVKFVSDSPNQPPLPPRPQVAILWGQGIKKQMEQASIKKTQPIVGKMPCLQKIKKIESRFGPANSGTNVGIPPPTVLTNVPLPYNQQKSQAGVSVHIPLSKDDIRQEIKKKNASKNPTPQAMDMESILKAAKAHMRARSEELPPEMEIPLPPLPAAQDKDPDALLDTRPPKETTPEPQKLKSEMEIMIEKHCQEPPPVYQGFEQDAWDEQVNVPVPQEDEQINKSIRQNYLSENKSAKLHGEEMDPKELELLGIDPNDFAGFGK